MIRNKILINEFNNKMLERVGSNPAAGKHLVVVDIQPEYLNWCKSILPSFIKFLNQNYQSFGSLTFFYNGYDTLGMITEDDYRTWLVDMGLDEEIAYNTKMYDKGYAFFRYCMDSNISEDSISNLVRMMMSKDIHDSRELTEEFWDEYVDNYGDKNIRELLEFADDCISIPDLMHELKNYRGIVLCGGGINECLKEVEIALNALNKPYNVLTKFTY